MIIFLKGEMNGNIDNYYFEEKGSFSTKDVIITIDFMSQEVNGECVVYGDWLVLEHEECLRYLQQLGENEIIRQFDDFL
ncbi:hypothetical protein SFC57_24145 [Niallia circulans]|uniref:hypothetical protein n=1 Tax=Bacillaceae TaxID=186817 RepID=UPI00397AEDBF